VENINAFIGHSFEEVDREIVRAFLDYFTTLSNSPGLNFCWEHAEEAQTMAISKKVKEKILGKNLFIGIFTKKERVIKNHLLKKSLLKPKVLVSDESNYEWKTSDWVLQELGYCLGKEMSAIILLEKGVRPISGLQADHEYIEFDRTNPTLSFERIFQQISSNIYKPSSDEVSSEATKELNEEQKDISISKAKITDWKNPDSNWDDIDYWVGLWFSVKEKDSSSEAKIYLAFKKKYEGNLAETALWEAKYLNIKHRFLNQSPISAIKKLIKDNPDVIDLHLELTEAYERFSSYELAFNECEIAIKASKEFNFYHLSKAVDLLEKSKGAEFARSYLKPYFNKSYKSLMDKYNLLKLYGNLNKEDFPNVFLSLAEAALAIEPDDSGLRFDLAYKYSELDLFEFSAYHYKILVKTAPSETHWNNLGVAYGNLNLNTKSIDAYLQSSKLDGTLAKSNLANKLLSIGFAEQAKQLCIKAMTIEDYDKRVTASLESVNEKIDSDLKADEAIDEDTKSERDFSIAFAKAFSTSSTDFKTGFYKYQNCNLEVTVTENRFEAYGVYEREVFGSGFGTGLLSMAGSQSNQKEHHKITFLGEIHGNSIVAKIIKEPSNNTLLGSSKSNVNALIYYMADEQSFYVSELTSNKQTLPYKMQLIELKLT
jgi:tetratricopeptide (TPR) repeat protein